MQILEGYKTYIAVVLAIIVAMLMELGFIDKTVGAGLLTVIIGGGAAAMRQGHKKDVERAFKMLEKKLKKERGEFRLD